MLEIKVYSDRGHAWGAVKRKLLQSLGVLSQVSSYSYQRGDTVYLEEDCDLSLLIHELKAKGMQFSFIEKHTDKRSPIRSYDSFNRMGY
jgi:hypothetical protein